MSLRIPQNQITSKYTSGGEYLIESSHESYTGYYYELNGGLFAGKTFNVNAPTLIAVQSDKTNSLLLNISTYAYGRVSGTKINTSTVLSQQTPQFANTRYFSYQTTKSLIKEINLDTYNNLKSDPIYKIVALDCTNKGGFYDSDLQKAEQTIPGITTFVNTSYVNPPIEEDGSIG
jgi:hypothetical protein